jgi:hypothetical protein
MMFLLIGIFQQAGLYSETPSGSVSAFFAGENVTACEMNGEVR